VSVVLAIATLWIQHDADKRARDAQRIAEKNASQTQLTVTLSGARDLSGIDLRDQDLRDFHLANKNLTGANLNGADLRGAVLRRAQLSGASLKDAQLDHADLVSVDLTEAILSGPSESHSSTITGAVLVGANLAGGTLVAASLAGANLQDANLAGATLRFADLRRANLRGANLAGADLRYALLSEADVRGTQFDVDLRPAKHLNEAALSRVTADATTSWPDGRRPRPYPTAPSTRPRPEDAVQDTVVRADGELVVTDGDTLKLAHFGRARLAGVNAPQREVSPPQCWAEQASKRLRQLVRNRVVYVEPVGTDVQGRREVLLWLPAGDFINQVMVQGGHARAKRSNGDLRPRKADWETLRRAMLYAQDQALGMWRDCAELALRHVQRP
jgi:uncharacterized protein YjbI with pentapeptide repeats